MNNTITPLLLENPELKLAFKAALLKILEERHDLLTDIIEEVVEDIALKNAIKQGESSQVVSRQEIFNVLGGA